MKKKTLKKYFNATIAATVAVSGATIIAPVSSSASTTFPDVKATDYFYNDVLNLVDRGVIKGFSDGKFRPNESVTRGQAAKIIAGVLGLDTKNVKDPGFKDVTKSNEYYGAIAALANEGIINGYQDKTYKPNQPVQRNHMAKIISNAFEINPTPSATTPLTDMHKDYKNYITALYENGITTGRTATTFDGIANVTRGQLAAFVIRAENVKKGISNEPTPGAGKTSNITFTVENINNTTIQTSSGKFEVSKALQPVFSSKNATALKNANITATVVNGIITEISALTINAPGKENSLIVFDGGKATIKGNVTVNADFVAVNNVTVNGNVTLTSKVGSEFSADGLITNGELIVDEAASNVASLNAFFANTEKGPKINLKKSIIKALHAKRDNVAINSDSKLTEVIVSAKVTAIEVNANVDKVTVNVSVNLTITGKGSIDQVTVEKAVELALEVAGQVKELVVSDKNAKVEVGVNVTIDKLVVPSGSNTASVIKNYNSVKDKIKDVQTSDGKTTNPGSSNGSRDSDKESSNKNFTLSLMHTNDTHANLDNIAKTVTVVKEVRAQKPDALLLNAGDVFSGTLYFNEFQGKADLAFMNLLKYDAMTFGNHEFDLGKSKEGHQALADFIAGANFPFVSANVNFAADEKFQGLFSDLISSDPKNGKIYNGIVKEINGEKVGIFGLTTAETKDLSSPEKITFEDYKTEAEKAVKAFEQQGIDKIIAITHIGYDDNAAIDNDLKLAAEVEGIDVIVGGHSHTTLTEPKVVAEDETPTVIVQTGANNSNLGVLDVEFDSRGVVLKQDGKLVAIGKQAEDAEAAAILKPYKDKVNELAAQEIGVSTEVALENPRTGDAGNTTGESVRKNETVLGNLITDGMLAKAKEATGKDVIMALQNGGGIRAKIDQGPITVGEVITVLPFGNTLAVMDVTGAELKEAFEISFFKYPDENGGFLHVAGGKVRFDSSKPAGQRVVSLQYKNAEGHYVDVQDDETYTVATNAFTAQGGDGYTVFAKAYAEGRVKDLGLSDWENLREHLQGLDSIPTEIEGRIAEIVKDPGKTPETVEVTEPPLLTTGDSTALTVKQIGRYDSGQGATGTEILAYDAKRKLAFVTNGADAVKGFDILSFANLESGKFTAVNSLKRISLRDYNIKELGNPDITSIASHPTKDLIAITAVSENKTDDGYIVFATKEGEYVKHVKVGALPDMVTFTPDGKKAIVANEGEPADDYSVDPEGSISIIDLEDNYDVTNLTFTESILDSNVRWNSYVASGDSALVQLEPEYVTVSDDSTMAFVSLQENNAIATIDLENGKILSVKGLGVKDHSVEGNEIDAHNKDGINIQKLPLLSYYMPDAIDAFTKDGKSYIITPNEGDSRDWEFYSEETELEEIQDKIKLNADLYEGYTQEELDKFVADGKLTQLGKIKLTKENGLNENGEYEALYAFGGRSFSIFDAETMDLKFDSGSQFEKIIAEKTPELFNIDNEKVKQDDRSDNKGPEPETVVTGEVDGKTYAFIALERYSGIMVYDLTDVTSPDFVTLVSSRDFSEDIKGDVSPEGLVFISASESPTGKALLVATHETSGTVAVYEFGAGIGTTPEKVQEVQATDFSGSTNSPKVFKNSVKVDVSNIDSLSNATIDGDLILTGTKETEITFSNIVITGNLNLEEFNGVNISFDGITVEVDTTL